MQNTINIYLAKPENVPDIADSILDHVEQARAQTFKFPKDQQLYTAAHVFLRQALSRHADMAPADWRFSSNAYGKPAITNPAYSGLQFNLSHTNGLLACVIAHRFPVGIDVERHKHLPELISLCHSIFSQTETAEILSLAGSHLREQRFFTYWTLKEAYIKARGMGLSIPLQSFEFRQNQKENWYLKETGPARHSYTDWRFLSKEIISGYSLAVAVQCGKMPGFTLQWLYADNALSATGSM